jgi:hypothetical protein
MTKHDKITINDEMYDSRRTTNFDIVDHNDFDAPVEDDKLFTVSPIHPDDDDFVDHLTESELVKYGSREQQRFLQDEKIAQQIALENVLKEAISSPPELVHTQDYDDDLKVFEALLAQDKKERLEAEEKRQREEKETIEKMIKKVEEYEKNGFKLEGANISEKYECVLDYEEGLVREFEKEQKQKELEEKQKKEKKELEEKEKKEKKQQRDFEKKQREWDDKNSKRQKVDTLAHETKRLRPNQAKMQELNRGIKSLDKKECKQDKIDREKLKRIAKRAFNNSLKAYDANRVPEAKERVPYVPERIQNGKVQGIAIEHLEPKDEDLSDDVVLTKNEKKRLREVEQIIIPEKTKVSSVSVSVVPVKVPSPVSVPISVPISVPVVKVASVVQVKKSINPFDCLDEVQEQTQEQVPMPKVAMSKVALPKVAPVQAPKKECRYGSGCRNSKCPFSHGVKSHEVKSHEVKVQATQSQTPLKTILCKSVLEGKDCRYGSRCSFAHSVKELAQKPCSYGDKCCWVCCNENSYNNSKPEQRICNYFHPNETGDNYIARMRKIQYVAPVEKKKQAPVLNNKSFPALKK